MKRAWAAAAVAVLLGACGPGASTGPLGNDDGGDKIQGTPSGPLLPLAVGSTWTYKVTDTLTGTVLQKDTKVVDFKPLENQPEVKVYVIESVTGASKSIVYVENKDDFALRHREDEYRAGSLVESDLFAPASLRGPVAMPGAGQTFTDAYTEEDHNPDGSVKHTKNENYVWNVDSVTDRVTVPAGTFTAVKMRRVKTSSGKEKLTWWVPGVGKIKEVEDTVEELSSYSIAK